MISDYFYKKFTVGYNGNIDPQIFLEIISNYEFAIKSIFFGMNSLMPTHQGGVCIKGEDQLKRYIESDKNVVSLLELLRNLPYKKTLLLNVSFVNLNEFDLEFFVETKVIPFINFFQIDSIVVADYKLAYFIRKHSNIEIEGSCNQYLWNPIQYKRWKEEIGVEIFNPPRETIRMPNLLKELHENGIKSKCIVNEGCMFGCPENLRHSLKSSTGFDLTTKLYCDTRTKDFLFKENWVTPSYLKEIKDYVHLFKLSTRVISEIYLKKILDSYIMEDDSVNLLDVTYSYIHPKVQGKIIPMNQIPHYLFKCECKKCDNCKICDNLVKKFNL